MKAKDLVMPSDTFVHRHVGPTETDVQAMLKTLGVDDLEALVGQTIPQGIRMQGDLQIGPARGEHELLAELKRMASKNQIKKNMIGMGYYGCITPGVILRNILENPGWYTAYTPYQSEIAQGRMEALVNFQTLISDLTGLPLANASLLDEATAAAEAMSVCLAVGRGKKKTFFVSDRCHPQTIEVVRTRARPIDVELQVGSLEDLDLSSGQVAGILVQYPDTEGRLVDHRALIQSAHDAGALVVMATDLLALTLLESPGTLGADIAIGSAQRLGVPLGAGGPHAAFMSTHEAHKRHMPGRIIGVSKDAQGQVGFRLALQTREQHIRRDRATSNICTAQVLLAVISSMYAVYHGPQGLKRIAQRVHALASVLAAGLEAAGIQMLDAPFFDTLRLLVSPEEGQRAFDAAAAAGINLRKFEDGGLGISCDETTTLDDVQTLLKVLAPDGALSAQTFAEHTEPRLPPAFVRTTEYLTHEVFHAYHAEHEMLRYLHRLESKDLSLTTSMIALGSCTMKLNGTSEMVPVTWPEFGGIHPFAPASQTEGYRALYTSLENFLKDITGMQGCSLQPNAGSQGEYAGLLVIRAYHEARSEGHRNVCLIPTSAHGTNPASASMAGMKVVAVACDERGNIDVEDLQAKAEKHRDALAALMVTYPSTHGVFEAEIRKICEVVHQNGGQVYMDGANMNAQVGLTRPGDFGADVLHLNLHKTFCIPHGGGGPGMGPICTVGHLAPYLPGHPQREDGPEHGIGPISAAPYGSPSILPISWVYIALMGSAGLRRASQVAILNANYMAERLKGHYPVLYTGTSGRVAHEFIIDIRPFKKATKVEVDDVAKRLMDYGFHAPTMSFPVAGTMMIEPTESESKAELDRFCEAMISIREEIRAIEEGKMSAEDNPLKNAPHTAHVVTSQAWDHPYSREQAAFPAPWLKAHKFWPSVGRVDNAYGDRNLVCTCPPMSSYDADQE